MRFQTTVRPVLTPLGERLMNLSERKLYSLDALVGGRDEPTLRKGVLVREAVRSAWRSVENGQQVEVTNWQSNTAMGLDVIGEDEEEEEEEAAVGDAQAEEIHNAVVEQKNEKWFEELVQSFGEDDGAEQHEWIESEVGSPVDYDDFDYEDFEHYTLPSPPPSSPVQLPVSLISPISSLSSITDSPTSSVIELDPQVVSTSTIDVDIVEVPDYDEIVVESFEVTSWPVSDDSIPSTPLLSAACSPSSSPIPLISLTDDELDCDDLALPPPLHRCPSSSSLPCECDDFESDGDCATPTSSCDDLEASVGSLLGVNADMLDPGDTVRLAFDLAAAASPTSVSKVQQWQQWEYDEPPSPPTRFGSLGLSFDVLSSD